MLFDNTSLDRLAQHENELRQVQSGIHQLLSELADCEADDGCRIPSPPVREFSQGLAGMLFRLRHSIASNDMLFETQEFQNMETQEPSKNAQLREQRSVLIDNLDELAELAISFSRVSSWSEIETRFLHFSLSLTEHLAEQKDVVQRQAEQSAKFVDRVCTLNQSLPARFI